MKYIAQFSLEDKEKLNSLFKYHASPLVRRRAHMLLLSSEKFSINDIYNEPRKLDHRLR